MSDDTQRRIEYEELVMRVSLAFIDVLKQIDTPEEDGRISFEDFLMRVRQALIIALGAIEEYLGRERSIPPRHKR